MTLYCDFCKKKNKAIVSYGEEGTNCYVCAICSHPVDFPPSAMSTEEMDKKLNELEAAYSIDPNKEMNMTIAFDVDDTLIIPAIATGLDRDIPNYDTIAVYRWFQEQGHTMWIWSGGGEDYARMWGTKLGLRADAYYDKGIHSDEKKRLGTPAPYKPDIAFDDCLVDLAKVNVRVKRINNQRKRN